MKFLSFIHEGAERSGVLTRDEAGVIPFPKGMSLLDAASLSACAEAAEKILPLTDVSLLAPIPHPAQDVICLGINYTDHAAESARFHKDAFDVGESHAVYFSKRVDTALPPGGVIPSYPGFVEGLDYEAELAVVLGRDAFRVPESGVYPYVLGYTVLNDISARNLQTRHNQWYFGKSLDGFCPMGPYLVTADAFSWPPALAIRSRVNGELRQESNTANLIHSIPKIISELSQGMRLKAGTIISTGTPAGVGMGFSPPKFLRPGDVVACEIDGIGRLVNSVGAR